jgi:hypothetical protein
MMFYCYFNNNQVIWASQIGSNGTKQWRYYDYGPKSVAPLVCLSGTAGTADVFYKQILTLCLKVPFMKSFVLLSASLTIRVDLNARLLG